jgi:hypothetical protein
MELERLRWREDLHKFLQMPARQSAEDSKKDIESSFEASLLDSKDGSKVVDKHASDHLDPCGTDRIMSAQEADLERTSKQGFQSERIRLVRFYHKYLDFFMDSISHQIGTPMMRS